MKKEQKSNRIRLRAWGEEDDNPYTDEQFRQPDVKVPWKSIGLALFLFLVGTILLTLGALLFTGTIQGTDNKDDRWLPMLVLGSVMFIPGSYHVWIAYHAWQAAPGYSYADIPSYDD